MLNDADISRFHHVYVFVGKTDLRKGIDGLSTLVKQKFHLDPFHAGDLFLFCGSSNRRRMAFCLSISGWRQELFNGPDQRLKPVTLLRNSIICS
mgnify:CR=1 FL=1